MSDENLNAAIDKIHQIAEVNRYRRNIVDTFLRKSKRKKELNELTSLSLSLSGYIDDVHTVVTLVEFL